MGFCVLHYDKQTGSAPGLSQHIERGYYRDGEWVEWHPDNVDPSRTHLNRELIPGDLRRDERINKRIKEAGIKPRKNQVRALTLIMTASREDMQRIVDEGRLDDWCESSLKWAKDTHGEDNVVSAVLHMDETTPHLHVTVIPIVNGISKDQAYRKKRAQEAEERGIEQKKKRDYKRKAADALRLCAADVMARTKLREYQTSYAEAVKQYGLTRGVEGSKANHVDINDWYRSLVIEVQELESKKDGLSSEIEKLNNSKTTLSSEIEELGNSKVKIENAVKNTAKGVGEAIASIGKGIGSGLKEMGTYAIPSKARDREKAAEKKVEEASQREKKVRALHKAALEERDSMKHQRDEAIKERNSFISQYRKDIDNIDGLRKTIEQLETTHKEFQQLLDDSAEIGLTALQTLEVYKAKGNEVRIPHVTIQGHDSHLFSKDGEGFRIKFSKRLTIYAQDKWQSIKSFVEYARDSIRELLRTQDQPHQTKGLGR